MGGEGREMEHKPVFAELLNREKQTQQEPLESLQLLALLTHLVFPTSHFSAKAHRSFRRIKTIP